MQLLVSHCRAFGVLNRWKSEAEDCKKNVCLTRFFYSNLRIQELPLPDAAASAAPLSSARREATRQAEIAEASFVLSRFSATQLGVAARAITRVWRVQNRRLWGRYADRRAEVAEDTARHAHAVAANHNPPHACERGAGVNPALEDAANERLCVNFLLSWHSLRPFPFFLTPACSCSLFHGADPSTIKAIVASGFECRIASMGGALGAGCVVLLRRHCRRSPRPHGHTCLSLNFAEPTLPKTLRTQPNTAPWCVLKPKKGQLVHVVVPDTSPYRSPSPQPPYVSLCFNCLFITCSLTLTLLPAVGSRRHAQGPGGGPRGGHAPVVHHQLPSVTQELTPSTNHLLMIIARVALGRTGVASPQARIAPPGFSSVGDGALTGISLFFVAHFFWFIGGGHRPSQIYAVFDNYAAYPAYVIEMSTAGINTGASAALSAMATMAAAAAAGMMPSWAMGMPGGGAGRRKRR